jgi:Rod binding domain-containing protein
MDGLESIGMPASLPLAEVPDRTPYSVSLRSRPGAQAIGETVRTDRSAASELQNEEKKKQVGKDFESVLLTKLFEQVQSSIEDSGFDDQDSGSQQVRGMFWLYLARDVADKGGFGLWKDVYQHIKQMTGGGDPTGSMDEEL